LEILILLGAVTGFVSGFFGVGGGTILVPMLLLAGFEMKNAVAISIMQMVFSSTYGSFLNFKKNTSILKDGLVIGFGGFLGGSLSGIVVSLIDSIYLKYIFLIVIIFTLYRIIFSSPEPIKEKASKSKSVLILIGFVIGVIAMSIGVGGSVMLTPILAGYMYYNLKDASSLGLFFVIFSSIAGFLSHSISGHMLYYEGAIIGIASLVGVYYGIKVKNMINLKSYKQLTVGLYVIILLSIIYKL
jgi:hypothetical protein